jgi:Effector Associated Constant Component 1
VAEILIKVVGFADSDAAEREELALRLREELRDADFHDVARPDGTALPRAKGDALAWAQLVVTLAGSLPPLLSAVRGWLGRHAGASVVVEIDGDRLELSDASPAEQHDAVAAWLARHG